MQEDSDVLQVNFYLSSTQHLPLLLLHLLLLLILLLLLLLRVLLLCSSLSCVPRFSPISLHSPLLINCVCVSRPKTASCCPPHPLFVSSDFHRFLFFPPPLSCLAVPPPSFLSSLPPFLLFLVGEGHGRHHPQWFTAVPVLPSGLQSADTAPDAESDSPPQGQRRAGLHRCTQTHTHVHTYVHVTITQ